MLIGIICFFHSRQTIGVHPNIHCCHVYLHTVFIHVIGAGDSHSCSVFISEILIYRTQKVFTYNACIKFSFFLAYPLPRKQTDNVPTPSIQFNSIQFIILSTTSMVYKILIKIYLRAFVQNISTAFLGFNSFDI